MTEKISLIACNIFRKEIEGIISSDRYADVNIITRTSTCGTIPEFVARNCENVKACGASDTLCIPLHTNCMGDKCEAPPLNSEYLTNSNCCSLLVAEELVDFYISKGCYIVAVGWLKNWRHFVCELWGFNEQTAKVFFRNSASKIIILDTGVYKDTKHDASVFADFAGIAYEILPVGIKYLERYIDSIVNQQKKRKALAELKTSKSNYDKQQADNFLLLDFIRKMADYKSEESLIDVILNLCAMLFAPNILCYISKSNTRGYIYHSLLRAVNPDEYEGALNFKGTHAETRSGKGLIIKVEFNAVCYGFLVIDNLLFPEHLSKYALTLQVIAANAAMFIANVRYLRDLQMAKEDAEMKACVINEQKEELATINEDLKSINEALEEASATKDRFISILGHDLKNPFSALFGFLDLLISNVNKYDKDKILRHLEVMRSATEQTYNLLENLLEWSQNQRGKTPFKPQTVDLYSLATQTLTHLHLAAKEKQIAVQLSIPKQMEVYADVDMIKAVVRNLVSNAIKFTPNNGLVSITASHNAQVVLIEICDTGRGMDELTCQSLFKIDKTKSQNGTNGEKGTGFGLLLCKEFVDRHKGRISVESSPGTGSRFTVALPIAEAVE